MIKNFNAVIILFFILASAVSFAQADKKISDKKAGALADSLKMKGVKDTSAVKNKTAQPYTVIKSKSPLSYNAEGYLLNKDALYKIDYKSTGDALYHIPFGFLQDLGSGGLPSESMLYGSGSGHVSFNDDGIGINNRLFNTYDLTNFQSERVDSIEIYPLAGAFLYSRMNDNSTINFVSKDRVKEKQYSRLKFYQGPNREGFIDFIFSMPVAKNFFLSTEITNNSVKDRYVNSEAGGWRASVKLRYNLSTKINLLANYGYVNTETKLNGGVNLDSLKLLYPASWETYLYDEKRAPVNYYNRGEKVLNHSVSIRMLADLFGGGQTDIAGYFQSGLNEFRLNDTVQTSVERYPGMVVNRDNNKYSAYGLKANQDFSLGWFDLKFMLNYEKNKMNSPLLAGEKNHSLFSLGAVSTFHLIDSTINPSVFLKQLSYNSNHYFGYGAGLNIAAAKNIFIYSGYSSYKKPYNVFEEEGLAKTGFLPSQEITNFEANIRYIKNDFDIRIGYFSTKNSNAAMPVFIKPDGTQEYNAGYYSSADRSSDGLNALIKYKFFKVLATINTSTYFNRDGQTANSPAFTFDGGIFYVDTLFNKNLNLKAGFNFKYYSAQNFIYYDFEKSVSSPIVKSAIGAADNQIFKTANTFRVDFFLAGKVQDAAIVYFTFENLLDKKYFMIPYYPAMGRSIRFGISWEFLD